MYLPRRRAVAALAACVLTLVSCGGAPSAPEATQSSTRTRFEQFAREFAGKVTEAGGIELTSMDGRTVTVVAADGSMARQVYTPAGRDPGTMILDWAGGYVYRDRADVENRGYGDPSFGYVRRFVANWPSGAWLRVSISEQASRPLLMPLLLLLLQKTPDALVSVRDLGVAYELLVTGNLLDPEASSRPYKTYIVEYVGPKLRFVGPDRAQMYLERYTGLDVDTRSFKILDDTPARRAAVVENFKDSAVKLARTALSLTELDVTVEELSKVPLPAATEEMIVLFDTRGIALLDHRTYRADKRRFGLWVCPGPRTADPADLVRERPCD